MKFSIQLPRARLEIGYSRWKRRLVFRSFRKS